MRRREHHKLQSSLLGERTRGRLRDTRMRRTHGGQSPPTAAVSPAVEGHVGGHLVPPDSHRPFTAILGHEGINESEKKREHGIRCGKANEFAPKGGLSSPTAWDWKSKRNSTPRVYRFQTTTFCILNDCSL